MQIFRHAALFLKVAELGSLSAAGRALGLGHSSVSRQLAQLEAEVGARLVNRSTRSMSLTAAGQIVRHQFLKAGDVRDAIEAELRADMLSGTLRVTLSHAFALGMVLPSLPEFRRRHPGLLVSLHLSNRREEMVQGGYDLAIRNGPSTDTALVGRRLGETPFVVVASPAYLASTGTPGTIEDIAGHPVVAFHPTQEAPRRWVLTCGSERREVTVTPALRVDDLQAAFGATELGLGLACLPQRLCRDALRVGRLVRCLPEWEGERISTYALYPSRRTLHPKVRAFVDHLARHLEFG